MPDFTLITGGPVYRFVGRYGLLRTGQHVAVASMLAWFPLILLTLIAELTGSRGVLLRFIVDPAPHVRFLLAVPVLLGIGPVIDRWLSIVLQHLKSSGIIKPAGIAELETVISKLIRLRNSWLPEITILALAIINSMIQMFFETQAAAVPWLVSLNDSGASLRMAGWWYYLVSLPVFGFMIIIWAWRFVIWAWVLWRVSKLDLQLIPTHPDEAGGLAFLTISQKVFGMVGLAIGAVFTASIWQNILYRGASVLDFRYSVVAYALLAPAFILAPLLVFTPALLKTHYKGWITYSALGNKYTESFDDKWIQGRNPDNEALLGTSDIQSLADLANSFSVVRGMRSVPFAVKDYIALFVFFSLPLIPLVLMVVPAKELAQKLLGLLF